MNRHYLDARRLLCPMPVIRVQDRIKDIEHGELLEVVFTDPGALYDIPAWARINGHVVVESSEGEEESMLVIQVGGSLNVAVQAHE